MSTSLPPKQLLEASSVRKKALTKAKAKAKGESKSKLMLWRPWSDRLVPQWVSSLLAAALREVKHQASTRAIKPLLMVPPTLTPSTSMKT